MKKAQGIITYICACVLSVLAVLSSADMAVRVVAAGEGGSNAATTPNRNFSSELESDSLDNTDTTNKSEKTDSTEKNDTSSAVAADSDKTAVGKLIEKTLKPSGSAVQGVYLRNLTGATINVSSFLSMKSGLPIKSSNSPQVLIIHTHSTESYIMHDKDYYTDSDTSRSLDNSKNVVALGEIVCKKLESAGISTYHIKTQFDNPSYTGSYTRAAAEIKKVLKANPSIKFVLDIHRDALSSGNDKIKPVVKVNGKKAAQVMLVMGSQTGSVTGFENWKDNLAIAVKYQKSLTEVDTYFPRALMLSSKKYNQNLSKGMMLLEIGTDANSFEEASYAAELAGEALAKTLK